MPAIVLVSAAAIGYEILLMRVLSIVQWHHFAYMIISLALLGYGASGTFIAVFRDVLEPRFETVFSASALLFAVTMILCFVTGQSVPFNALEIIWDPWQWLNLGVLYLVFFIPFFFAACCIGLALTCRHVVASRIYFADLVGAGAGAVLIIVAMFAVPPGGAIFVLVGFALAAAILSGVKRLSYRACLLTVAAAASMVGTVASGDWLWPRISEYKGLSQALEVVDARRMLETSSPLGLLTVVESPTVPLHHAPGLSLATRHMPPDQLGVFTDGDAMSAITKYAGNDLAYLGDVTSALPFQLVDKPNVLVLGAGGGTDVLLALHHGATRVDAVELNPQIVELVARTFADYAGRVYTAPQVNVHIGEARGFIMRSGRRFDLIHIGLLDSFGAAGAGVQALNESYLYTVEALQHYLEHLDRGGILSITRWLKLPPRDSLKLFATAIESLRRAGVGNPADRLVMIRSWNTTTLLVRNEAFAPADIDAIREFARSRSFDTVYYPQMPATEANRFNQLQEAYLYDAAVGLLGDEPESLFARYKFHIEPATDDRPYFFRFFKWGSLNEILELRERGGAGLIEWGYLVVVATLLQAIVAGTLLILLPLLSIERRWPPGAGARLGSYFFLLGLAFLFIEIAFIQKFILFLSHPLYSVAVVLAGFLVFAGLGSAFSSRFRGRTPVALAVGAIAAISLLYLFALPPLFGRLIGLPDAMRIMLSAGLVAPLAFCMGMPFPLGLQRAGDIAPGFIPWAWGINGFASVLSAALASLLAIEIGFSGVLLLALGLYAAAAVVARAW